MKQFKFVFLTLFLLGLALNSCKSDDDTSQTPNVDLIVGTWKITDVWVGGESVYVLILLSNPCPLQSKFIFDNDFSVMVETVVEDETTGSCIPGEVQQGSWSKEGTTYYFHAEGETASSEVEFLDDNNFTFIAEIEGETAKVKLTRQ